MTVSEIVIMVVIMVVVLLPPPVDPAIRLKEWLSKKIKHGGPKE